MSDTVVTQVGKHEFKINGDAMHFDWMGPMTEGDVSFFFDGMYKMMEQHGSGFLLMNVANGEAVTADARRKVMSYNKQPPFSGVVIYAASFKMKVVCNLIVNAVNLLRKDPHVVVFKKDLAEAREWIKQRRAEINAPGSSTIA